jgi:hypothetical protein
MGIYAGLEAIIMLISIFLSIYGDYLLFSNY